MGVGRSVRDGLPAERVAAYRVGMGALSVRYREVVSPRLLNWCLSLPAPTELRATVCVGLAGEVIEIGFGAGLNVPFYPAGVTSVAAVEPADVGWRLAGKRIAASSVPVRRAGVDGQRLPFADATFDTAVSTWTLCSVPDAPAALTELRRVLRPGGRYPFLEHGRAPDVRVRKMQRRMRPVHPRLFGGCDFTEPVLELIVEAGFKVDHVESFYQRAAPRYVGADSRGAAVNPT